MKTDVTINDVKKIDLPQIIDVRGNLSFVEEYKHIPFKVETAYWIYDVPGGEGLEGCSFKESSEFIVGISGNFEVILNDAYKEKTFLLNRSCFGIYIPAMIWRRIENFSTNSLAFILSSSSHADDDCIRDFEEFLSLKKYGNE